MKIGVLGTGAVGRAVGGKLMELGHDVVFGTRDVAKTMADTKPDYMGNPPFSVWIKTHPKAKLAPFADAAAHGEALVNATTGAASLKALSLAGERNLADKILIDIANPLDFSKGMPPSLIVCNTDSLGEQIQRAFPKAKVVKTLNTMTNMVMVNPDLVAEGDHDVFVSGNDAGAKAKVTEILRSFGWKRVVDLGDITTARGVEMVVPVWVQLMGTMKTPMFNFKIAR
ncbi:MAG TPA: NAD(P)-binding domain-containing protein [Thermoplasmata archaeon]